MEEKAPSVQSSQRNFALFRTLWDPLCGDPRFEQIVASFAPKDAASPTK
jgi:hypothetical protein